MKKSILFLPASIRSHVIPALYVADLLADEYTVYVAVTNDVLAEIVTKQGFQAIRTSSYRIGLGMESGFVADTKKSRSRWQVLKAIVKNEVYWHRRNELEQIIDRINPAAILIDIFNSTDLLAVYPKAKNRKLLFVNPMLSTYRIPGFPTVSEGVWPEQREETMPVRNQRTPWRIKLRYPYQTLMGWLLDRQFKQLGSIDQFLDKHPIANDRTNALLFENIPELVLAPLELEFSPQVRKPNQYYLGLCTRQNRKDTELDPSFESRFGAILNRKQAGDRLIYCTFGTYYEGSDKVLLMFLNTLLDALQAIPFVQAVFSVNRLVIETLRYQRSLPPNVHLFTRVPQLTVLKHTDVYVTHGGLSSVKESILFNVPMLVYPLDLHYDQNGNGFKVEYHGLGLRGIFSQERVEAMQVKITRLLEEPTFRGTLRQFRDSMAETYQPEALKTVMNELVSAQIHELQSC
ncbi:nucleotide disphospho-sugar-binding domain-containing protein [Larkinella sp. VNQ87]|uniref:nucleotide disphospho-sugar-binding domain-containing protein n=1 Tax=Larkinella sp. VNQ87 TaxID=3400921 RepID=UPI003C010004